LARAGNTGACWIGASCFGAAAFGASKSAVKKSKELRRSRCIGAPYSLIDCILLCLDSCIERFLASFSCAVLLWDGALWGRSGDDVAEPCDWCRSSTEETDRRGVRFEREGKREFDVVKGDVGSDISVRVVSRDRCEPAELSESSAELREEVEDTEFEAFRCARISATFGALYESMFVVDRRATGPEILRMSTGLSELLKLPARRGRVGLMIASVRLLRRVKALDIDMLRGDNGFFKYRGPHYLDDGGLAPDRLI